MIGVLSCETPTAVKNGDAGGRSLSFRPAITGVHVIRRLFAVAPVF